MITQNVYILCNLCLYLPIRAHLFLSLAVLATSVHTVEYLLPTLTSYDAHSSFSLCAFGPQGADPPPFLNKYTDKNEKKNFLIYWEIQSGPVAKSYIRNGFLIYEEMQKFPHI
jgi:hypothetical protein